VFLAFYRYATGSDTDEEIVIGELKVKERPALLTADVPDDE